MKMNTYPLHRLLGASLGLALAIPGFASAQDDHEETRREVREVIEDAREVARVAAEEAREAARTWTWSWSSDDENERAKGPEPYVGVTIESVPRALRRYIDIPKGVGLLLVRIHEDSPADKAGLEDDDIMVEFNHQLIINFDQFSTLVNLLKDGDVVPVTVVRKGGRETFDLTIEERIRKGNRWHAVPEAPEPPEPPEVPDAPAPPVGYFGPDSDHDDEVAYFTERLPANVRIITDGGNAMHLDLSQLKSNLSEMEERLRHLEVRGKDVEFDADEVFDRLKNLRTVVIGSPNKGPRQSIVHMGDTVLSLQLDEGKVRLFTEEGDRRALVTDPQGVVLFDDVVPEDLEVSDLDPRVKSLINTLLQTTEDVDFEFQNEPDIPVELEISTKSSS